MEYIINFFSEYGYWGMGILAFLSGSIVPITSEVLLVLFLSLGLNAVALTLVATLGNTLGGVTCFFLGMLANKERGYQSKRIVLKNASLLNRWLALHLYMIL